MQAFQGNFPLDRLRQRSIWTHTHLQVPTITDQGTLRTAVYRSIHHDSFFDNPLLFAQTVDRSLLCYGLNTGSSVVRGEGRMECKWLVRYPITYLANSARRFNWILRNQITLHCFSFIIPLLAKCISVIVIPFSRPRGCDDSRRLQSLI